MRRDALKGRWYPASAMECRQFFAAVEPAETTLRRARGAIVPHAGWTYSGRIAYATLAALAEHAAPPSGVVLFGGHLGPRDRPRLMPRGAYQTPLGAIPVDETLATDLLSASPIEFALETEAEFREDNATEVLLPMIRALWPDRPLLVLGVPPTELALELADILAAQVRREHGQYLAIGSTDLTHYGPSYDFTPAGRGETALRWARDENDTAILKAMIRSAPEEVLASARELSNACCPGAAAAAIRFAAALGPCEVNLLAHTTSQEVAPRPGEISDFVGYAGLLIGGPSTETRATR